jgi:hypothetical protein
LFVDITGASMRDRYVDRFKILSPSFHTDEIFIRSTSKDRTLMSAYVRSTTGASNRVSCSQAFLQGLYPPGTGPQVPALPIPSLRTCGAEPASTVTCAQLTSNVPALQYGIQPVPIHAADTHQDTLLYAYKNCPRCAPSISTFLSPLQSNNRQTTRADKDRALEREVAAKGNGSAAHSGGAESSVRLSVAAA